MRTATIELFGDSILQGVQVNPANNRYYKKNEIDLASIGKVYNLSFQNDSHFGCTVTKGKQILEKLLASGLTCDAIVMDFGGNDCDFKWSEIAADPDGTYEPHTPITTFLEEYRGMIHRLREHGITPILATLPPLEPQRFFDWWCRTLNKENVMRWLGSISTIYKHQEQYSDQILALALEENVPVIDIRGEFLAHGDIGSLICEDGTHPNSKGQELITRAFQQFFSGFHPDADSAISQH